MYTNNQHALDSLHHAGKWLCTSLFWFLHHKNGVNKSHHLCAFQGYCEDKLISLVKHEANRILNSNCTNNHNSSKETLSCCGYYNLVAWELNLRLVIIEIYGGETLIGTPFGDAHVFSFSIEIRNICLHLGSWGDSLFSLAAINLINDSTYCLHQCITDLERNWSLHLSYYVF